MMSLAHDAISGGHLGIEKTREKIMSNFYWFGIYEDVARYCRSSEKTVSKGTVQKAPMENMPVVDFPFKRVAVILIGPIEPASEAGHRYILTLVDYAKRYPEAVPLKRIDTATVAEALVGIYSRLGVPDEILSDQGTQFISDCIRKNAGFLDLHSLHLHHITRCVWPGQEVQRHIKEDVEEAAQ